MLGIDISNNQGLVDFRAMYADGVRFVWLKATEGVTWNDSRFQRNLVAARKAGLRVGAYHWARPDNNDPHAEAAHFLSVAFPLRGDLLPALDFEEPQAAHSSERPLVRWARDWLDDVEKAIGQKPIFYSYPSYIAGPMRGADGVKEFPLWLASYGPNDGRRHAVHVPAGFTMVAHQYTSKGRIGRRFPIDLNELHVPLERITYRPGKARLAVLRKWILDRRLAGWSWEKIKATANWREFKRRGGQ